MIKKFKSQVTINRADNVTIVLKLGTTEHIPVQEKQYYQLSPVLYTVNTNIPWGTKVWLFNMVWISETKQH